MTADRLSSAGTPLTKLAALAAAAVLAGVLAGTWTPAAALAGGMAALGVALGLARPAWGLVTALAVAVLVPFVVVPQRFGVQPPVLDVIVAATVAGTAIRAIRDRPEFRRRWNLIPRWLLVVVALGATLPLAAGAAAFGASSDGEAAQLAVKMSLYALIPPVVAVWWQGSRSPGTLGALITAAAALQAGVAIVLHLAGAVGVEFLESLGTAGYPTTGVARFLPDQVTPRATGLLVDPNVLGVTLAAALPFGLTWIGGGQRRTALGLAAIALIGGALALTISRASWIASAAGVLVWLALVRPRLAATAAAVLGAAVVAAPLEPFERIRQGLLGEDRSAALRLGEIREAFRVISRFPLLGVGYGDAPHADIFAGVSNGWLWLAERAGVVAALSHLALICGAAQAAVKSAVTDPALRPLLASLAAFAVAGVFDHHIVSFPHLVFLVGGLAGLVVARVSNGASSPA
ncbi:MAG: O-antigen ligase family protein [Chloroflexota bacterium]|nr:O-antigen ligase family protein [Chloroflexota bacterium]MDE2918576.1 O-antigen ligase family protein [Chloroflexota bacterium]